MIHNLDRFLPSRMIVRVPNPLPKAREARNEPVCLGYAGGWGLHENINFFLLLNNFLFFFFGSYSPSLYWPNIFFLYTSSLSSSTPISSRRKAKGRVLDLTSHMTLVCSSHLPFKQTQFSLLQLSDVLALYNWPHIQGVLTVSRAMFIETGRYTGKTHLHSMQWHTGRYRHELMQSSMHLSTLCSSAWEISSFLIRYRQDTLM